MARSRSPPITINSSVVDKLGEDEGRRLVRWRLGQNRNNHSTRPNSMPPNRYIVEVLEDLDTESVNQPLSEQHGSIDAWSTSG